MRAAYGRRSRAHFDAKGEGNKLFADAGVPTTYLNTTFFYQGFLNGMTPKRADDGLLSLSLPFEEGKLLAGVDVNDIGRNIGLAGDRLTGSQYAGILGEVVGEPVRFQAVPYDVFRALDIPAGDEIANMFQYYGDFDEQFTGARDLDRIRTLKPALKSFRTWARENADALKSAV